MTEALDGKVAIITGATSGIGEATARLFASEGAAVVVAGRSEDRGKSIAADLGHGAFFHTTDVTREAEVGALVDAALDRFGHVDCLFNNAGGPAPWALATVTEEAVDQAMRLLAGSVLFGMKHAARAMASSGGSIINNSSIAAHRSAQGGLLYSMAKAAVSHATHLAAVELGPQRIRVNAISPGAIATPIFWGGSQRASQLSESDNEDKMRRLGQNLAVATPTPRSGTADDIAQAALFLASDASSFVTGHDLVVDGGRIWAYHEAGRARDTRQPR